MAVRHDLGMGVFDRIKQGPSSPSTARGAPPVAIEDPPAARRGVSGSALESRQAAQAAPQDVIEGEDDAQAVLREERRRERMLRTTPRGAGLLQMAREGRAFDRESQEVFLDALAATCSFEAACLEANVMPHKVRALMAQDADFNSAVELAKAARPSQAKQEAFRRAIEGTAKGVWFQGALAGLERVHSDSLMGKILEAEVDGYQRKQQLEAKIDVGVTWLQLVRLADKNPEREPEEIDVTPRNR